MSQPDLPQATIELVKKWEGWHRPLSDGRAAPYLCPSAVWTQGFGATFGLDGKPITPEHSPITREEGEVLLRAQLAIFRRGVVGLVRVPLTANQLGALTSFAFNVGLGRLRASTLLRKVNASDFPGAAAEFPKWVRGGGRVLPGLVARRVEEQALFLRPVEVGPASGSAGSRNGYLERPAMSEEPSGVTRTAPPWLNRFVEAFRRDHQGKPTPR